jgi:hypothetical protein
VKLVDLLRDEADNSPERIVFFGLVVFLVLDRTIPDLYVLPVGFSLKVSHVLAGFVVLLLVWAMTVEMRPLPSGVAGFFGLLTLGVTLSGPFVNASTFSAYEENAADLGLVTVLLLTGLFLAAHYLGQRGTRPMKLIWVVIVLAAIQAAIAGWEKASGWLLTRDTSFLKLGFLVPDPGIDRGFVFGSSRIGGGFRPVATAPHPIVLSALSGVAVLLLIAIYPYVSKGGRRWLFLLLAPLMMGLVAAETRTGMVITAVGAILALGIAFARTADKVLPLIVSAGFLMAGAIAAFPSSARTALNQFSRLGSDPSVAARTSDTGALYELMYRRPLLGPGFMTHDPALRLFDNSYFEAMIEFGIIGFGVFMAFLVLVTLKPAQSLRDASEHDAPILIAGFVAGLSLLVGMALFDATKFVQFFPTILIVLGLGLGRADAIVRETSRTRTTDAVVEDLGNARRRP